MHFLKQLFTSFGFALLIVASVLLLVIAVCFAVNFIVNLGVWVVPLIVFCLIWYCVHKELF